MIAALDLFAFHHFLVKYWIIYYCWNKL